MKLVKLVLGMRRSSDIEGSFIVDNDEWDWLESLDGNQIYLGEVAGKHSEVIFDFSLSDLEILSEDPKEIEIVQRLLGDSFGFHWKDYLIGGFLDDMHENAWTDFVEKDSFEQSCEDHGYVGSIAQKYRAIWNDVETELAKTTSEEE
jgi:hypothetical protein